MSETGFISRDGLGEGYTVLISQLQKRWICFILLPVLFHLSCGPRPGTEKVEFNGFAMATTYSVVIVGLEPDSVIAKQLQMDTAAVIARIESLMSIFEPESDISRFNASSTTDWFPVAQETADVVGIALEISRETDGIFDITVGQAVEVWRDIADTSEPGASGSRNHIDIDLIDYRYLDIRNSPPALRKSKRDIHLDLSGIAKGYAVDRAAALIEDQGFDRYMVEIGGEIRTAGLNIDSGPWEIGIEVPAESGLDPVFHLTDAAVATSGDYRNFLVSGERRLSHFINPRTGIPTDTAGLSVTVVGKECARVDAIATALAVLGPEEGYDLAVEKNWRVYFIYRHGDEWKDRATITFESLFHPDSISGIKSLSAR
jgi:thiamine biosynthesis lipoprotein